MRRWLLLLGGMLVWGLHFGGVYAIASVADVVARADAPAARLAVGGLTLVCLAANLLILNRAVKLVRAPRDDVDGLTGAVAALGAVLSIVGVAWQGLPALIGH